MPILPSSRGAATRAWTGWSRRADWTSSSSSLSPRSQPDGNKPLTLTIDRGDKVSVEGELIKIRWEGEPAHALVTAAQAAAPEKPAPAMAELTELRSILDTATDGVVLLDRGGLILSANRSAEALFGYEELAGRPFTELFAPESVEVARNYLDGLVRDGVASLLNGGREVIGRARQGG